ncbi:mycofactocin system glycosyltransferase [Rhodococcus hoagii]|nr:mycofactocin system glycosyltransferase [Prescottella equi]
MTLLRHDVSRGPAAARNTGLHAAQTPFVAFLDSDVVPKTGWLELMLGHFSDPRGGTGGAAHRGPRTRGFDACPVRAHALSSLDLGRKEAAVRSGSPVAYVPSAAMLVRRDVLVEAGGFDETMHVAEDVDLCWRLQESGWRLRYEPVSQVAHDHRVTFRKWFSRKLFYGTVAAPLASRHDGMVPPLAMSKWTLFAVLAAATGTRIGLLGSLATLLVTATRLRRTFRELDQPTRIARDPRSSRLCRWRMATRVRDVPSLLAGDVPAVLCSRRIRCAWPWRWPSPRAVVDWLKHREPGGLDPLRHTAFKRLDDVAYGAGLWQGAIRARDLRALAPRIGS